MLQKGKIEKSNNNFVMPLKDKHHPKQTLNSDKVIKTILYVYLVYRNALSYFFLITKGIRHEQRMAFPRLKHL